LEFLIEKLYQNLYHFFNILSAFGVDVNKFFGFDILAAVESLPPRTLNVMQKLLEIRQKFTDYHNFPEIERMALEMPPTIVLPALEKGLTKNTLKYLKVVLENKSR
jgi:hypothetical protein